MDAIAAGGSLTKRATGRIVLYLRSLRGEASGVAAGLCESRRDCDSTRRIKRHRPEPLPNPPSLLDRRVLTSQLMTNWTFPRAMCRSAVRSRRVEGLYGVRDATLPGGGRQRGRTPWQQRCAVKRDLHDPPLSSQPTRRKSEDCVASNAAQSYPCTSTGPRRIVRSYSRTYCSALWPHDQSCRMPVSMSCAHTGLCWYARTARSSASARASDV